MHAFVVVYRVPPSSHGDPSLPVSIAAFIISVLIALLVARR